MKRLIQGMMVLMFILPLSIQAGEGDGHDDEHGDGHDETAVKMTQAEREKIGVTVAHVELQALGETLSLPAEVVTNKYRSARVTPRIAAQVTARHVQLGDYVEVGQKLVTLSSVDMAEAQGELLVANREWQRVKRLGKQTVSERRYIEAQIAQQQARAKVLAYGMTASQLESLLASGDVGQAVGAFDLLAPQAGTVLLDEFVLGELIEPGRPLFDISDESVMWVEAQMAPGSLPNIARGALARIRVDDDSWIDGVVVQRHHQLNETTRTQALRIEVENLNDQLHPGQFVEVEITTGSSKMRLAVPSAAVTMIEGESVVFKAEEDEFHPTEIEVGPTIGGWVVVQGGLNQGDEIAVTEVFHLKSLLLKSSLGEGHAH